ncbi:hypothetical protein TNCV_317671 [Trichonephila clavipes]|nr:hypothetical protein TNCV_317671 [Trichonephila clavipes]
MPVLGKALLIHRIGIGPRKPTSNTTESSQSALVGVNDVVRNMEEHLNWPIYFNGSLTSESYTDIYLDNSFLEDEVSLRDWSRMWYQYDGAPHTNLRNHGHCWRRHLTPRIIGYRSQR